MLHKCLAMHMRDGAHATHIFGTTHIVLTILTRHTSCLKTSAFAFNGSLVAEAMSRQRQAACSHTRFTSQGSNQYQTRVKCVECQKLLVLLYHSAPEEYVQHAMEQRHLWQASRTQASLPLGADNFPASEPKARANPAVRVARGTIQRRAHSDPPASQ